MHREGRDIPHLLSGSVAEGSSANIKTILLNVQNGRDEVSEVELGIMSPTSEE